MTDNILFSSALVQAQSLRSGKLSAQELVKASLSQIARYNDRLNAVIILDEERSLKAAKISDDCLRRGQPRGVFEGVPMTIKESFDWSGTVSSWGAEAYRDNVARSDAVALQRLEDSGAIMMGKTNVPFMLADWQSFNRLYGTTNNPWDIKRSPGGSSGGAAAALACGMSALELGSDIGGSLRNPAHYCGIYSHKPSAGLIPMEGHLLPGQVQANDMAVAGPLARSAYDLSAMMGLLVGPSAGLDRGMHFNLPLVPKIDLKDLRVAMMLDADVSEVDRQVQNLLASLAEFLGKRVKTFSLTARPDFTNTEAMDLFIMLLRSATSRRQSDEEFADNIIKVQNLSADDHSYVARMLRAHTVPHRRWLQLNERRHQMRLLWEEFFEQWDILLCPPAASAAFIHDHVGERHERAITVNGKQVPTTDQLFWAGYSGCFYLPSTIAPIGLTAHGLPSGVQIITRAYHDRLALKFAEILERDYYAFVPPPGYF